MLAFVAGGVAQLALRRSRGTEVKVKRAVEGSVIAAPVIEAQTADVTARPPSSPDTPAAEAQAAQEETPAQTEDVAGGRETAGETVRKAGHVSRASAKGARKVRYRARGGMSATTHRERAVSPNSGAADTRGSRMRQAAGGAKKSGNWLGRKLKKIGDVFHE